MRGSILVVFTGTLRTRFDEFEAQVKLRNDCDDDIKERVRQQNDRYNKTGSASELAQGPADQFRIGTSFNVVDNRPTGEKATGCQRGFNKTRFNKIATQGAPQMAVDKEANSLSRVSLTILSLTCAYSMYSPP